MLLATCLLPLVRLVGQDPTAGGHAGMAVHGATTPAVESAALEALIDSTRRGTMRFADRRAAIAAGYRLVGMDFPSMGEHWVNPSKLIAGGFDPFSPAILTYAMIDGEPRLLGAVYAVALEPNEKPPSIPGGAGVWHEHNGSIDEESLLPEHNGGDAPETRSPGTATATRLAILHVWTPLANPQGVFVAENWALPFVRNGVSVPSPVPLAAARALALVSGGEQYYRSLFRIGPSGSDVSSPAPTRESDEVALRVAILEAHSIFENRKNRKSLSAGELTALSATWERLTASIHRGP